jgi:hypothetical protein
MMENSIARLWINTEEEWNLLDLLIIKYLELAEIVISGQLMEIFIKNLIIVL